MRTLKTIGSILILFMVLSLTVSPAFGAVTIKDKDGNVVTDRVDSDKDVTDKIISDDEFLGFERKHNVDPFEDISVQNAIDLAASIPVWGLAVIVILILGVAVVFTYISVVVWNTLKGGKAAHGDNPVKAAQAIKDSKGITRAYTSQIVEGVLCVAGVIFLVALFR